MQPVRQINAYQLMTVERGHCWRVASLPVQLKPATAMGRVPWPKATLDTAVPVLLSPSCGAGRRNDAQ